MKPIHLLPLLVFAAALTVFGGAALATPVILCACPPTPTPSPLPTITPAPTPTPGFQSPFQHVIVLIQENRTPDNLFNGLPGANTVTQGLNSFGQEVQFKQLPLEWQADISHSHETWVTECDMQPNTTNCKMDGFNLAHTSDTSCNKHGNCPYAYVPQSETVPYFTMAEQYAFGDKMFATNQGPSFPGHQALITGADNTPPYTNPSFQIGDNPCDVNIPNCATHGGGCTDNPKALVNRIPLTPIGAPEGNAVYPCFDPQTLGDLADAAGVSWRYYEKQLGPGLWNPYEAVAHIVNGPDQANIIAPSQQILTDISLGNLAQISEVSPDGQHSDHSGNGGNGGPSWVAAVVNAVGKSQYWNNTVIIVTWDDWGGWYDHVVPPVTTNYNLGFRVPLLIISPYTKQGYVSEVTHSYGSILKFIEETFGLGSLFTSDYASDDLSDSFQYQATPRPFTVIPAPSFSPGSGPNAIMEDPDPAPNAGMTPQPGNTPGTSPALPPR